MAFNTLVGFALALASTANAQGFGGYGGNGGGNPYSSGSGSSSNPFSGGDSSYESFFSRESKIITAHAVLGALAFVVFFPAGGILIRLGSFRGLWLVHALLQIFGYLIYIATFGIGIYMATHLGLLNQAHPIIGIVLFVLLFFQPILGFLHHTMFKKHSRRVVWSYGHIWLGRIIITLGIINGGLGLQLAQQTRFAAPSKGGIIAYSVVGAVMWLAYVVAAVFGEVRRSRQTEGGAPPPYKEERGSDDMATAPGAPHGTREYYKQQRSGQQYA